MNCPPKLLKVVLNRPLSQSFDYRAPAEPNGQELVPGVRLRVPFGRGRHTAILLQRVDTSDVAPDRLKSVDEVLDREPLISESMLKFAQRAASYYHHPLGEVVFALLPPGLRDGGALPERTEARWFAARHASLPTEAGALARAPLQQRLLDYLNSRPDGASASMLREQAAGWRAAIAGLQRKALVENRPVKAPVALVARARTRPPELNAEQAEAVETVTNSKMFGCFLLDGVTGSGKTEVYLRLIEDCLRCGRQTLLLVPEIGLTPQLVERLRTRLDTGLVVFHSSLSDTERTRAWLSAADGSAGVIVGTRSAVFTPLRDPGLIVVDEEHDASFKQQDGFRYNARDLAVLRASQLGIPIVLGSATPSLESLNNALRGDYRVLRLRQRAGGAMPPKMSLLDLRGRFLHGAMADTLLPPIAQHLDSGSQVLVFLNRRGFAPVLLCHECGWTADCPRCDAHMTLHQASGRLRCHHCGAERASDAQCGDCGAGPMIAVGRGTERIEQDLRDQFPNHPVIRVDRDTTRRKGALDRMLEQIHQGEPALLVGTQMLGKGHHFPHVTLVVILDADRGLYGLDFRATESMAQTITQVAGRAGRAEKPGRVLLATHAPGHPALQALVSEGYGAFARKLLAERREAQLPPFRRFALLRAESHRADSTRAFLATVSELVQSWAVADVEILGPAAAPMERLAGRYRAQLLFQSEQRVPLHRLLQTLRPTLESMRAARKVRWSIDVDPIDMN